MGIIYVYSLNHSCFYFFVQKETKYPVEPGARYGRLTVVGFSHRNSHGAFFTVKCECGTVKTVARSNLSKIQSCGCFKRENTARMHTTHGMSIKSHPHHYIHELWSGIKRRCYCEGDKKNYAKYGARGIRIYAPWKNDFVAFHKWIIDNLGHRPSPAHSIDRINVNGNYEPGNLRWLDKIGQARNRRNSFRLKWGDGTVTLKHFCDKFGISYKAAWAFLNDPLVRERI